MFPKKSMLPYMKLLCTTLALLAATASVQSLSAAAAAAAPQAPKPQRIVNRVAATVNGRPITSSEVRGRLSPYLRELTMLYPQQGPRFNSELLKAKKAVLEELIERELVLSEFSTKGYVMPETAIDEEINRRILAQFGGKRDNLLDMLRQSSMTYSEYRNSVRKELTAGSMRASRYDTGIPPTPDEIKAEYEATKSEYRDILQDSIRYEKIFIPAIPDEKEIMGSVISRPGDPGFQDEVNALARSKAESQFRLAADVAKRLQEGEISFADAAREYSVDAYAKDGGQWPSIKRKELAVEFANIVFSAQPGKLVGPLLDPAGFTLVRVKSKTLAPAPPLSNPEIKDRVDDAVRRKQSEARYREWIRRLRNQAIIRTFI